MSQLWDLVWGKGEVDPAALAAAIENELDQAEPDFRTRLLIRDSTQALENYWGSKRLKDWLKNSRFRAKIESIQEEDLGQPGFPLLKEQLVDSTKPETVKELLRELGKKLNKPATLKVGGSIALILSGYLYRSTSDIDIVDEIPEAIRTERESLEELQKRYGLMLTHFQSHYLPAGWEERLQSIGSFGSLNVFVIDVYDVFLGKLFSKRRRDLDDLRALKPKLDKARLETQLTTTAAALLRDSTLRKNAEHNWYVLFSEDLPIKTKE